MESLKELFRIGCGPSSSHTMGVQRAAAAVRGRYSQAARFRIVLYGSLAATGRGHLTDLALASALSPIPADIEWRPDQVLPLHPNGMEFFALAPDGSVIGAQTMYSVGGGAIYDPQSPPQPKQVYQVSSMRLILEHCAASGQALWEFVEEAEGSAIWDYLSRVWKVMQASIARGLDHEGMLPGGLQLQRKAPAYYMRARNTGGSLRNISLLFAYALAVAEENAGGGEVVTAPTCGSAGVIPAVLRLLQSDSSPSETRILHALAVAGLIGNLVKTNASVSGAEVGCQGEIGTACAMAAAAATQLMGGTSQQIEYAAEMGLEHHLGLTCDPVGGLVQIPCIERNAMAAARALDCAAYALLSDGQHRIPFDEVVAAMAQTGRDLGSQYRETGTGGLAGRVAPALGGSPSEPASAPGPPQAGP